MRAGPRDSVVVLQPLRASSRVFRNVDVDQLLALERDGVPEEKRGNDEAPGEPARGVSQGAARRRVAFEDVKTLVRFERLREGMRTDDPQRGLWNCGQSVGLVKDVPCVGELVERLMAEAEEAIEALKKASAPRSHL